MKNIWFLVFLLMVFTACAGGGSRHEGCNMEGNLCIGLQIEEPVLYGAPNSITITVSSQIGIGNVKIFLDYFPQVLYEDNNNWVNKGISWVVDLQAGRPQTFIRRFLLPERDGYFQIVTYAFPPHQYRYAIYSLEIHQQQSGSTVYYENTPIPLTRIPLPTIGPELLQTLEAIPTSTLFPVITPIPTLPSTPTSFAYPMPTTPPMDAPVETPYP